MPSSVLDNYNISEDRRKTCPCEAYILVRESDLMKT